MAQKYNFLAFQTTLSKTVNAIQRRKIKHIRNVPKIVWGLIKYYKDNDKKNSIHGTMSLYLRSYTNFRHHNLSNLIIHYSELQVFAVHAETRGFLIACTGCFKKCPTCEFEYFWDYLMNINDRS